MSNRKHFDKEIVSAWVDGRADLQDQEPSLEQGSESMAVWARYHMIGQVMREEAQHLDLDISSSVSRAIANEETHSVSPREAAPQDNVIPFPSRVWKQAGGFAIAASVAIVALFSVSNTQLGDVNAVPANFAATTTSAENASEAGVDLSHQVAASTADRQELQTMHNMFLKHEALTRQITGTSSLPTVRVVSNQKVIPVQVPMRAKDDAQQDKSEQE
ncbi:sigma-E factor negative regulatory protein [Kangiella taiwanensis]|uniref:RseA family anti-sigma factor n=1 Tax=Kangiella taiwanensis TaxID=1079179 RepID=A0ABP8I2X8_9GAMM|nr:RseA family anti-sigma factor [Kangiella taiwanensis]